MLLCARIEVLQLLGVHQAAFDALIAPNQARRHGEGHQRRHKVIFACCRNGQEVGQFHPARKRQGPHGHDRLQNREGHRGIATTAPGVLGGAAVRIFPFRASPCLNDGLVFATLQLRPTAVVLVPLQGREPRHVGSESRHAIQHDHLVGRVDETAPELRRHGATQLLRGVAEEVDAPLLAVLGMVWISH
eukprot:Skav203935  [mRNA]  locus=scaffold779:44713:49751:- [translate_table: standard]